MNRRISYVITKWLIIIVLVTCVVSGLFRYFTLAGRVERNTRQIVRQDVEDVSRDVSEMEERSLLYFADQFMEDVISSVNADVSDDLSEELHDFYKDLDIEVNIVNSDGIVVISSNPEDVGFDMHSNEKTAEFLILLDGRTESFVQDVRGNSSDESVLMKYAGKRFPDGSGFIEVGVTSRKYYHDLREQAGISVTNRRIGEKGYILVANERQRIINSYQNLYIGKSISAAGIQLDPDQDYVFYDDTCDVFGVPSYVNINQVGGAYIIGVYPISEAIADINTMIKATVIMETVAFLILFIALTILLRKLIVKNMVKVNDSLNQITEGNLEERVEVRDTYEFNALSDDINATVDRLKEYIAETAARIDTDLEIAKAIQTSVLPNKFPPFPEQKEFELFASMHAAKEVGGDFYDYCMIGKDTLAFLVADVSGKSIPGAMFMMTGKSVIKNLVDSGLQPADVFSKANEKLNEGNDTCLFITAWMGYLDVHTGVVHAVNAGHNPPVIIRNGKAEFIKLPPGVVLAVMNGTTYQEHTIQLEKGDILFLYTDGVTEAINQDEEQYGDDRLLELLSFGDNYPVPREGSCVATAVCETVKEDLDRFVGGAEQFDDITMLAIKFK